MVCWSPGTVVYICAWQFCFVDAALPVFCTGRYEHIEEEQTGMKFSKKYDELCGSQRVSM